MSASYPALGCFFAAVLCHGSLFQLTGLLWRLGRGSVTPAKVGEVCPFAVSFSIRIASPTPKIIYLVQKHTHMYSEYLLIRLFILRDQLPKTVSRCGVMCWFRFVCSWCFFFSAFVLLSLSISPYLSPSLSPPPPPLFSHVPPLPSLVPHSLFGVRYVQAFSEVESKGILSAEALTNVRPFLQHMGVKDKDPFDALSRLEVLVRRIPVVKSVLGLTGSSGRRRFVRLESYCSRNPLFACF